MTQEEKNLLLNDLCGRLPYKVKLRFYASATKQAHIYTLLGLEPNADEPVIARTEEFHFYMLAGNVKPYLFPMSSMTEEQKEEYCQLQQKIIYNSKGPVNTDIINYINWCYKNHIDVNELIPLGLAIDATGLNIY